MTRDPYKLQRLEKARIGPGFGVAGYESTAADGMNGCFLLIRDGKRLACIVSDQEGWEHVSVTDQTARRSQETPPTWEDMCFIKSAFWDDEECVMQLHVPRADWINQHPGCLHLWRPISVEIPRPPGEFVGFNV